MKQLEKLAVALRECQRCGALVVVRYGVQQEHTRHGEVCRSNRPKRVTSDRTGSGVRA